MIEAHEIVHDIHEKFKGLSGRLERLFKKSANWWRSHGYVPKTIDPEASGNVSPVTHYIEYVEQFGAADRKAGILLNEKVFAELKARLTENEIESFTQSQLRRNLLKEATDAICALDERAIETACRNDLTRWESELVELRDITDKAIANVRAVRRLKNCEK